MAVNTAAWRMRALAAVALVGVLAACSSDGDQPSGDSGADVGESVDQTLPGDGDAEPTVTAAGDPADSIDLSSVDCAADGVELDAGWPYELADAVTVLATTNDLLRYRLVGFTTDAESTLADTLGVSFPDLESSEPKGSDSEVTVTFTGDAATAELRLVSTSTDGCWLVDVDAEYVQAPVVVPSGSTPGAVDPLDDLASVGSGDIITGRGNYSLAVVSCDLSALAIEATAREGSLQVAASDDASAAAIRWVYADGVEISDDRAVVLSLGSDTASFVANGTSPDGPETLVIDITC
jgi:hypothetical protein